MSPCTTCVFAKPARSRVGSGVAQCILDHVLRNCVHTNTDRTSLLTVFLTSHHRDDIVSARGLVLQKQFDGMEYDHRMVEVSEDTATLRE